MRFDIYLLPAQAPAGYMVDVQSDYLSHLDSRMVIPLIAADKFKTPVKSLGNYIFDSPVALAERMLIGKIGAMSVEQHNVIDFVTMEPSGGVILYISDQLHWEDVNEHLFALQEKVNAYLGFVESGEVEEKFPNSVGQTITIHIDLKFAPPAEVDWFFARVSGVINDAGIQFRYAILPLN